MSAIRLDPHLTIFRPTDFHTVGPNEFYANKNHASHDPHSLVLPWEIRWPNSPDWPAYPKALVEDSRLVRHKTDMSFLRPTDDNYWRYFLGQSRTKAEKRYVENLRKEDRSSVRLWEKLQDRESSFWGPLLRHRFAELVIGRQKAHLTTRKLQLALFQFIEDHARRHGFHEVEETKQLIRLGFKRHEAYWAWRLDDLYARLGTRGYGKLKGHGHMLELIMADLLWDIRRTVTAQHRTWRLDTLYTLTPNGGIAHLKHVPGHSLELVAAEAHWPVLKERRDLAGRWHEAITEVITPNGGLVHARRQGHEPELASALLEDPKLKQRRVMTRDWHESNLLQSTPNGAFRPASSALHGQPHELVTANVYWRARHTDTVKDEDWRLGHVFVALPNGNFIKTGTHHGSTFEKVSSDSAQPAKHEATKRTAEWHAGHLFQPTVGHGFAPLKGRGRSYEAVSAEATDRPRQKAEAATHMWHAMHRFRQTENHVFRPSKGGLTFEAVSGNELQRVTDRVTRRFYEQRLGDSYVPTDNRGMRHVPHQGKSMPAVEAEVAPPDEGPGEGSPLPSKGGRVLEEVKLRLQEKREFALKQSKKQWEKSLAAHEQHLSALQGHVLHGSRLTNDGEIQAQAPTEAGKAKKV